MRKFLKKLQQNISPTWKRKQANYVKKKKEFRIMRVKMIKNLENRMEKMQESINKDVEELKNNHTDKQHNY